MRNLGKFFTSWLDHGFSTHRELKAGFFAVLYGSVLVVSGVGSYLLGRPLLLIMAWVGIPVVIAGIVLVGLGLKKRQEADR